VDAAGNVLTLEAEGPCPGAPGKISRFRDVTEFKCRRKKQNSVSRRRGLEDAGGQVNARHDPALGGGDLASLAAG
jgi:hypothetical protein